MKLGLLLRVVERDCTSVSQSPFASTNPKIDFRLHTWRRCCSSSTSTDPLTRDRRCCQAVDAAALFSRNEAIEDVPTEHLRFLLTRYLLAEVGGPVGAVSMH